MMSHSEKARLESISNVSYLGLHEAERLSGLVGSLVVATLTRLLVERVLKISGGLVAEMKLAFLAGGLSFRVN
jgi:hypothetical protein